MSAPRLNFPYSSGGGGGGGISGSGTAGKLAVWTTASAVGDSQLSQVAGAISSLTLTSGGSGAVNGNYSSVALTGGAGTGATADVVVAGNAVTAIALRSPGSGYNVADVLSTSAVGGTGAQFTVGAVKVSVIDDGNFSAAKIGAGTANPVSGVDSLSGMTVRSPVQIMPVSASGAAANMAYVGFQVDSSGDGGIFSIPSSSNYRGVNVNPRLSFSASTNGYGAFNQVAAGAIAAGVTSFNMYSSFNLASVSGSGITGLTGGTIVAVRGQATIATAGAGNTWTSVYGGEFLPSVTTSTAQTVTALAGLHVQPTLSNAAHTVNNLYGLRLVATVNSGGATITNHYGISQEDSTAQNYFAGVINSTAAIRATGSTAGAPAFSTPGDTDTGLYFPAANQARISTGGSVGLGIDASQNLSFNSGFGSAGVAYGCRAWVNFNGQGVIAIRGSGNVSSITDNNVGNYTVNFTSAMPDVNFCLEGTKQSNTVNTSCVIYDVIASRTVSGALVYTLENAAFADPANVNVAVFR